MTYNKLTDEEIIKRLEYMRKNADEGYMAHLENGGEVDKNEEEYIDILCGTLDLINCLQSENKRLGKEVNLVSIQFQDLQERTNEVKAEAYKEFAERLKNEIISDTAYGCDTSQHTGYYDYQIKIGDIPEYIDNLLKEMVGEEE